MKTRRISALLLALILAPACLSGCRCSKQEEEPKVPTSMTVEEDEPLIAELPEDTDLGGD